MPTHRAMAADMADAALLKSALKHHQFPSGLGLPPSRDLLPSSSAAAVTFASTPISKGSPSARTANAQHTLLVSSPVTGRRYDLRALATSSALFDGESERRTTTQVTATPLRSDDEETKSVLTAIADVLTFGLNREAAEAAPPPATPAPTTTPRQEPAVTATPSTLKRQLSAQVRAQRLRQTAEAASTERKRAEGVHARLLSAGKHEEARSAAQLIAQLREKELESQTMYQRGFAVFSAMEDQRHIQPTPRTPTVPPHAEALKKLAALAVSERQAAEREVTKLRASGNFAAAAKAVMAVERLRKKESALQTAYQRGFLFFSNLETRGTKLTEEEMDEIRVLKDIANDNASAVKKTLAKAEFLRRSGKHEEAQEAEREMDRLREEEQTCRRAFDFFSSDPMDEMQHQLSQPASKEQIMEAQEAAAAASAERADLESHVIELRAQGKFKEAATAALAVERLKKDEQAIQLATQVVQASTLDATTSISEEEIRTLQAASAGASAEREEAESHVTELRAKGKFKEAATAALTVERLRKKEATLQSAYQRGFAIFSGMENAALSGRHAPQLLPPPASKEQIMEAQEAAAAASAERADLESHEIELRAQGKFKEAATAALAVERLKKDEQAIQLATQVVQASTLDATTSLSEEEIRTLQHAASMAQSEREEAESHVTELRAKGKFKEAATAALTVERLRKKEATLQSAYQRGFAALTALEKRGDWSAARMTHGITEDVPTKHVEAIERLASNVSVAREEAEREVTELRARGNFAAAAKAVIAVERLRKKESALQTLHDRSSANFSGAPLSAMSRQELEEVRAVAAVCGDLANDYREERESKQREVEALRSSGKHEEAQEAEREVDRLREEEQTCRRAFDFFSSDPMDEPHQAAAVHAPPPASKEQIMEAQEAAAAASAERADLESHVIELRAQGKFKEAATAALAVERLKKDEQAVQLATQVVQASTLDATTSLSEEEIRTLQHAASMAQSEREEAESHVTELRAKGKFKEAATAALTVGRLRKKEATLQSAYQRGFAALTALEKRGDWSAARMTHGITEDVPTKHVEAIERLASNVSVAREEAEREVTELRARGNFAAAAKAVIAVERLRKKESALQTLHDRSSANFSGAPLSAMSRQELEEVRAVAAVCGDLANDYREERESKQREVEALRSSGKHEEAQEAEREVDRLREEEQTCRRAFDFFSSDPMDEPHQAAAVHAPPPASKEQIMEAQEAAAAASAERADLESHVIELRAQGKFKEAATAALAVERLKKDEQAIQLATQVVQASTLDATTSLSEEEIRTLQHAASMAQSEREEAESHVTELRAKGKFKEAATAALTVGRLRKKEATLQSAYQRGFAALTALEKRGDWSAARMTHGITEDAPSADDVKSEVQGARAEREELEKEVERLERSGDHAAAAMAAAACARAKSVEKALSSAVSGDAITLNSEEIVQVQDELKRTLDEEAAQAKSSDKLRAKGLLKEAMMAAVACERLRSRGKALERALTSSSLGSSLKTPSVSWNLETPAPTLQQSLETAINERRQYIEDEEEQDGGEEEEDLNELDVLEEQLATVASEREAAEGEEARLRARGLLKQAATAAMACESLKSRERALRGALELAKNESAATDLESQEKAKKMATQKLALGGDVHAAATATKEAEKLHRRAAAASRMVENAAPSEEDVIALAESAALVEEEVKRAEAEIEKLRGTGNFKEAAKRVRVVTRLRKRQAVVQSAFEKAKGKFEAIQRVGQAPNTMDVPRRSLHNLFVKTPGTVDATSKDAAESMSSQGKLAVSEATAPGVRQAYDDDDLPSASAKLASRAMQTASVMKEEKRSGNDSPGTMRDSLLREGMAQAQRFRSPAAARATPGTGAANVAARAAGVGSNAGVPKSTLRVGRLNSSLKAQPSRLRAAEESVAARNFSAKASATRSALGRAGRTADRVSKQFSFFS
ncbi:hypothetical protein NFJ02_34g87140 [Pycnococcus provasolii]